MKLAKPNLSKFSLFLALSALIIMIIFPLVILSKQLFSKPTAPVYLTIKLNQGYWWVNTPSPPLTFIEAIKPQLTAYDFLHQPTVQVLNKRVYPTFSTNTLRPVYNTYIDLKLYRPKTANQEIFFNRQRVAIGEPIDIKFPHLSLSGSIIKLSAQPTAPTTQTYAITLKKLVYPWEYQKLTPPVSYFDGQTKVFTITSKECAPAIILTKDKYNQLIKKTDQNTCYLTLKGTIELQQHNQTLTFGPEIPIAQGLSVFLPLDQTYLTDFTVISLRPLHQQTSQTKK